MADIGSANIKLGLTLEGFQKSLNDAKHGIGEFEKSVNDHKKSLREWGTLLSVIGGSIVAMLAVSVKGAAEQRQEYAELELAVQKTGTSFKTAKVDIDAMSDSLQKTTRYGDTDTRNVLRTLINLTGDYSGSLGAVKNVLDFASGAHIDLNTATLLYGKVMTGNVEMLKRYGIDLEAMTGIELKGLSLTEKKNVAMKVLNERYGGFAEKEGKEFLIILKQIYNYVGDFAENIGDILLPNLTSFASWIKEITIGIVEWSNEHKTLLATVVSIAAVIGGLAAILGPLALMLPTLAAGFTMIGTALITLFSVLMAHPIILTITAIVAAIGLLYAAWKNNWGGIQDTTTRVLAFLGAHFDVFKEVVGDVMYYLGRIINGAIVLILEGEIKLFEVLGKETGALKSQLAAVQGAIADSEKEHLKNRGKTFEDYYDERMQKSKIAALDEIDNMEIVAIKEDEHLQDKVKGHGEATKKIIDLRIIAAELDAQKAAEEIEKWNETQNARVLKTEEILSFISGKWTDYFNTHLLEEQKFAESQGMTLDEYEKKALNVIEKIEKGQGDSLTEQERAIANHITKVTGDVGGYGEFALKTKNIFTGIKVDFRAKLDDMSEAIAKRIVEDGDFNFKNLGATVKGVFTDIRDSFLGTLKLMVTDFATQFIANILKSAVNDLVNPLSSILGGLTKSITGAVSGGGGAVTGGGGTVVGGGAGGGITGGIGGAVTIAAPLAVAYGFYYAITRRPRSRGVPPPTPEQALQGAYNAAVGEGYTGPKDWDSLIEWYKMTHAVTQAQVEAAAITRYDNPEGFARGGIVPDTMRALLHAGEMVLPKNISKFVIQSAKNMVPGQTGITIESGAVVISGAGQDVMNNINRLTDLISEKLAEKIERRVVFQL